MMLEPWMHSLPAMWQNVVHGGYLAVGTFFVLSGFVLGQSYSAASWDRRSLLRYGAARCARVYPVYALSLLVMLPIIAAELRVPERTGVELSQKAALLANYGLVLQGWFHNLPVYWNTPAWSLSCEFFFYLCFPIAALLLRGAGWLRLGAMTLFALALPNLLSAMDVPAAFKPLYHVGDFLIGITAARLYSEVLRERWRGLGYWLYVPAAVCGFVIVAAPLLVPHSVTLNSALRPFNAVLLTGLALGGGFPVSALSTGMAGFLGRASYAMYILHIPILWWFKRYFSGVWTPNTMALIYITGVIALSGFVCERVEEPANKRIRGWVSARLRPSVQRSAV
jgi:peptidoglycan/LPS O-acetylase OafA/YrhL